MFIILIDIYKWLNQLNVKYLCLLIHREITAEHLCLLIHREKQLLRETTIIE